MVARTILRDLGFHTLDLIPDRLLVELPLGNEVDGITHQNRRVSRVEDDNGLALLCLADHFHRFRRRFCKLVDVLARAWPASEAGNGADHLCILWRRDLAPSTS